MKIVNTLRIRIKEIRDKQSLRQNLNIHFLIAVTIAAFITNGALYQFYSAREKSIIKSDSQQRLYQTMLYSDQYLGIIETIGDVIWINEKVQNLRNQRVQNIGYLAYRELMNYVKELSLSVSSIYRIHIYFEKSDTIVTSDNGVFYRTDEKTREYLIDCMNSSDKGSWYIDYPKAMISYIKTAPNTISLLRPIFSAASGEKLGLVAIQIKNSSLDKILKKEDKSEEFWILEGEHVIVSHEHENEPMLTQLIQKGLIKKQQTERDGSFTFSYKQGNFVCNYQTSDYNDFVYVTCYNAKIPLSKKSQMMFYIIFIAIIYFLVYLAIMKIAKNNVTDPVEVVITAMRQVQEGKFDTRIKERRSDEIGYIYEQFNNMSARIQNLIDEVVKERVMKNDTKLKFLQSQVNPHFIYNIFNNMIWLVEQGKYEQLEEMISATAGYYKMSLNFGNSKILLSNSKEQLIYYATIQKFRFGDKFDYEIDFDEDIMDYYIPNLLLQPLLENAINHGASMKEGNTFIYVHVYKGDGSIIFEIVDNGVGIERERLSSIKEAMKSDEYDGKDFFAISNIAKRLRLYYKGNARFEIDSTYGKGTEIIIEIPLLEIE